MTWDLNMSNLRNVLAGLYWNQESTYRVIQSVGLNPAFVRWDNSPMNTWQSILEEAMLRYKVQAIIDYAKEQYPDIQSLVLAEQNRLLAVETPWITDTDWMAPTDSGQLEKIIGPQNTLLPIKFLEQGLAVSKSVARIVLPDGSTGTGFLISDDLLMTNNHVLGSRDEARTATIEFNYQETVEGRNAPVDEYHPTIENEIDFITSSNIDGDDWAAVRIQGRPGQIWGKLTLSNLTPEVGDQAIIIQHPGGAQKQIAFYHNIIVALNDYRIQYLTDTLEGSSGSPVFDNEWNVIAVHHRGGQHEPHAKTNKWRNQGVRSNMIIEKLSAKGIL